MELLISIMSSLAQEESRSISENCTWGQRKRFQDGKVTVPFGRFLGYDRGEDGNLVINESEAKIVRRIYGLFLQGHSPHAIAKILTADGIMTPGKKKVWSNSTVKSILTNEKYKGDALLQKVYTADFLSKKKIKNDGQVPQYYVEDNHPAIIMPIIFDRVQTLMSSRHPGKNRHSCITPFSSKIKCGECGSWYGSKVWHSNDKYRKVVWQCNHKFDGNTKCKTPYITDIEIKSLFIKAMNNVIKNKDSLIFEFNTIKDSVFNLPALIREKEKLQAELNQIATMIEKCISENARIALNQEEYQRRYRCLVARYENINKLLDEKNKVLSDKKSRYDMIEQFLTELAKQNIVTDFSEELWYSMVDYVTVFSKDNIQFTFKDGTKITV